MPEAFEARKSDYAPGLNKFLLSVFGNLKYTVAEDGLSVSMPVFHTWKFSYRDIESATRMAAAEAQGLVSGYPGIFGPGQYHELDRDLAHLIIYSSQGEIEPDYRSPASSVFNTREDFVLLKAKMGGKPVRLLLSPQDIEGFLASLGRRLRP